MTSRETVRFGPVEAWHWTGSPALHGAAGRPVVVMAHGLAGTKDSGLAAFAEPLAEAGCDVVAFDYRGFGGSDGEPRQTVSMAGQLADYQRVADAARALPGVDPRRLVLWGVSLAGGHVLAAAAARDDVAAVVSLTPLVDGVAAGRHALRHHTLRQIARSTVLGVRSRVGAPRTMPVVAPPGDVGALTLPGAVEAYTAIAGPTWRNEVDAAVGLELGRFRPARVAGEVRAPVLVQIADFDRSAPPHAAARAATAARAVVHHYPCDHFDVWAGNDWHAPAVRDQLRFLTRVLAPAQDSPASR